MTIPVPTFRTLLSRSAGSLLLADGASEGEALAAAFKALDAYRQHGLVCDEVPAKNRHGVRRWQAKAPDGSIAELFVEPDVNMHTFDPGWLLSAGYPIGAGWWADTATGLVPVA